MYFTHVLGQASTPTPAQPSASHPVVSVSLSLLSVSLSRPGQPETDQKRAAGQDGGSRVRRLRGYVPLRYEVRYVLHRTQRREPLRPVSIGCRGLLVDVQKGCASLHQELPPNPSAGFHGWGRQGTVWVVGSTTNEYTLYDGETACSHRGSERWFVCLGGPAVSDQRSAGCGKHSWASWALFGQSFSDIPHIPNSVSPCRPLQSCPFPAVQLPLRLLVGTLKLRREGGSLSTGNGDGLHVEKGEMVKEKRFQLKTNGLAMDLRRLRYLGFHVLPVLCTYTPAHFMFFFCHPRLTFPSKPGFGVVALFAPR